MKNLSSEGAFTWNCAKIQMFETQQYKQRKWDMFDYFQTL